MKSLNILSIVLVSLFALSNVGCGKGPKGDPGAPGAPGPVGPLGGGNDSKIVRTVYCDKSFGGILAGISVEYDITIMDSHDVYVSAVVIDEEAQYSATRFYAFGQPGSLTSDMVITRDYLGPINDGFWKFSYNVNTDVADVDYMDGADTVLMTFSPTDCTAQNW